MTLYKFVPKGLINNIPVLVQTMVWRHPSDKPLSEPMMVSLVTHINVSLSLNESTNLCHLWNLQLISIPFFTDLHIWHIRDPNQYGQFVQNVYGCYTFCKRIHPLSSYGQMTFWKISVQDGFQMYYFYCHTHHVFMYILTVTVDICVGMVSFTHLKWENY